MQTPIDLSSPPSGSGEGGRADVVLVSRDLIFISKITGTARALGFGVAVAGNAALVSKTIDDVKPKVILVDLAAGEPGKAEAIVSYRKAAGTEVPIVAFGSHVDIASLDAAREAGCREVMPRSRFTVELPDLIRKYCGHSEPTGS
jgi:DNA-binding NarL/FixJ family response regulator